MSLCLYKDIEKRIFYPFSNIFLLYRKFLKKKNIKKEATLNKLKSIIKVCLKLQTS